MAHLFKPHITRYRMPDSKAVAKGTPGRGRSKNGRKSGTANWTNTTGAAAGFHCVPINRQRNRC